MPTPPPYAVPLLAIDQQDALSDFAATFSPAATGQLAWITTIDATAIEAEPTQWWCRMDLNGAVFFHDSQSIGEGLGVRFEWRGDLMVPFGDTLTVTLHLISGTGPAPVAVVASGFVVPMNSVA